MSSSREFNRILSFLAAAVLEIISSIGTMGSFAQNELTTASTASTQDQESNATATASFGNPFLVEQGRITEQRVLVGMPQPLLERSVIANASINKGIGSVIKG